MFATNSVALFAILALVTSLPTQESPALDGSRLGNQSVEPLHIPVSRRNSAHENYKLTVQALQSKIATVSKVAASSGILTNFQSLGLLYNAQCTNPSNDNSCVGKKVNLQDTTLKATGKSFTTTYGTGDVTGDIYQAQVSIGSLTATIPVGVSTVENASPNTDGIMGLGFDGAASMISQALSGARANFFDALQFPSNQNLFGFYLNSFNGNGIVTLGGRRRRLTLGVDSSRFTGTPTYLPVIKAANGLFIGWFFDLSGCSITIPETSIQAVPLSSTNVLTGLSDTGTSAIVLTTSMANAINKAIGASSNGDVPCSAAKTAPIINFNLKGQNFPLPPSIYIRNFGNNQGCASLIMGGAETFRNIILGDAFLQQYYSIYDKSTSPPRVGFAPAVAGNGNGDLGPKGSASSLTLSAFATFAAVACFVL
ncbi:1,3-beta-glucanosyltransferase [Kappamyces sp. JEL0680]|nr:1,3-beta-glucanosyltransferase [Kappamyces sp. JEL0680]